MSLKEAPRQEISKPERSPFPEDPESRYEAILAAIGNSEAKCIALLTLQSYFQSTGDLRREFLRASGGAWTPKNPALQGYYADRSLIPQGLAESITLPDGKSMYKITPAGEHFGKPIAAFLIQKSTELHLPLAKLIGKSSPGRGENRPVVTRTKILEQLSHHGVQSEREIVEATGIHFAVVSLHLNELRRAHLVDLSSASNAGEVKYLVVPYKEVSDVRPGISAEILRIINELGTVDSLTIKKELKRIDPNNNTGLGWITTLLTDFSRQGLLKRALGELRPGRKQIFSRANLTEEGKYLVERVLLPVKSALDPNGEFALENWRKIPWRDYAPTALASHSAHSGEANPKSTESWVSEALEIIRSNPGIRPNELRDRLQRRPGDFLSILVNQGLVRKIKEGRAVRYYPI